MQSFATAKINFSSLKN